MRRLLRCVVFLFLLALFCSECSLAETVACPTRRDENRLGCTCTKWAHRCHVMTWPMVARCTYTVMVSCMALQDPAPCTLSGPVHPAPLRRFWVAKFPGTPFGGAVSKNDASSGSRCMIYPRTLYLETVSPCRDSSLQ